MKLMPPGLRAAYVAALKSFFAGAGERALKRAYDLGRRAVNEGQGVLALVLLHQKVVAPLAGKARGSSRTALLVRSMTFLTEALAAFEMAHRGFREAYARVRELNEKYEALVADRTRELRRAEEKYRAHLEQFPAVTYIESLGGEGTVYVNRRIETLLGFTASEWVEDAGLWLRQIHAADRERVLKDLSCFREGGGKLRTEYRLLTRSGRERAVRHEALVVRDDASQPLYIQGYLLDVGGGPESDGPRRESEAASAGTGAGA